ncbi:hypothetical protein BDV96DRAFT_499317 [Lophiotrema nucula]|uniref:Apple domain-containing protein n=1 Tax=Lophiotrema nucula TaxID=690887 RepID=A0A6A5YZT6_9PLEO|nr:hypothetical protein BDV96DRAFT_499317 [Lophiotrema nucula]
MKSASLLALASLVFALPQNVPVLAENDNACAPQPRGAGPVPNPDTPEAFLAYDFFEKTALSAAAPSGYFQSFQNLQASNKEDGYMDYSSLSSYDVSACAARCDAKDGCSSFNIYFERDPTLRPAASCANPASTTNIKCVLWGSLISAQNAVNTGQWRRDFHVVIAGSNGYVKNIFAPIEDFENPTYLGNSAINALLDCNNVYTYMGYKKFSLPYDPSKCAAACSSQNDYNLAHLPANGSAPRLCMYFNSYVLEKNGAPKEQVCSLYTRAWPKSFATNDGQWRGKDHYTVSWSFGFTNSTVPSAPCQREQSP